MAKNKQKIDFVGIGVNKAATTWIHRCLDAHPDICMALPKETRFFSTHYELGPSWYAKRFSHCANTRLFGEYSPDYLDHPDASARIHRYAPDAKLIASLRNPKERLLSAFYYGKARGKFGYKTVAEKLQKFPGPDLQKGLYHQNLSRYLKLFPREQLLILFYDDIKKDPVACVRQIYSFLGVDNTFVPDIATRKVNITTKRRVHVMGINRVLFGIRRRLRNLPHGPKILHVFKKTGINEIVKAIFRLNRKRPQTTESLIERRIDNKTDTYLTNYYRKDIEALEDMVGRDLSGWKKT